MKKPLLTLFCLAVVSTMPLLLTGCDRAHAANSPDQRQPPTGRDCTVQFRRDFLGTSRDLPVSPTANTIGGSETCVRGRLMAVTDEWVVLAYAVPVGNKPLEREFWIPRNVVLLIDIAPR
jgi:hypothetical protein